MKQLKRITLVQFYLHEESDIDIHGATAFLGPNGSGKSTTLDAIQIAMLGGNLNYLNFNTQLVSSKRRRSIASYCLGQLRNPDKDSEIEARARDEARTYIILVFDDGTPGGTLSAGLCVEADCDSDKHEIKGLFILPGQALRANDCVIATETERRPLPYAEFREQARAQGKKVNRTPIFTDKSSEYVSELLYALNGERMPNPVRFMSAFVKSMTLKNVDSIDQFVRENVVEPNPVDVGTFRKQVEQFVSLRDLIKKTKQRISILTEICGDYERARSAERRIASLQAIFAIFNQESLAENLDECEQRQTLYREQQARAHAEAIEAKEKRDSISEELARLRLRLESDQSEQRRVYLDAQIRHYNELIRAFQQPELMRANRIINAIRDVLNDDELRSLRENMSGILERLLGARSSEIPGQQVTKAFQDLRDELVLLDSVVRQELSRLNDSLRECREEAEAMRRRISAATQTGRLLNDGPSQLLELLTSHGMFAKPISALATIVDSSWAPAIEAYLGGDRDALVVLEGDTQRAVKLLREARKNGARIDGAAIVQPVHLRDIDISPKNTSYAVGLFECTNETAQRFLWRKFGGMRLVDTEGELEQIKHALTRDGMLSQGGLTKSIRVCSASDLRLGKNVLDTASLSRKLATIQQQEDTLSKRQRRLDSLYKVLVNDESEESNSLVVSIDDARAHLGRAEQELVSLDVSHLDELHERQSKLEAEQQKFDRAYTEAIRLEGGFEEQARQCQNQKAELEYRAPSIREAARQAVANPLVDIIWMDERKDEIERSETSYEKRLSNVRKQQEDYEARMKRASDKALVTLANYVKEEQLDVQLSAMAWYDHFKWAVDERQKLTETQLHQYEAEAEQARLASEETLRSDIAMSLNDRFKEMELERRERNKLLDACPPFTGGERYRFSASVVPHYEPLVRHISQIANADQSLSLFSNEDDEVNDTLRQLVDAAAETGNANAILDYRQFYTFDLDIMVDGKRVDRMSNRQGAGSNGEHIAPMYIAAGAALAKAYRLNHRKENQGFGMMCLDEAFHGMDTTNAVATAKFLQSIGLQLIMAGPELERTKLAPISETIYDLDREGLDLLMDCTKFTLAANALMISDMPGSKMVEENAYRQLGFEPPSGTPSEEVTRV